MAVLFRSGQFLGLGSGGGGIVGNGANTHIASVPQYDIRNLILQDTDQHVMVVETPATIWMDNPGVETDATGWVALHATSSSRDITQFNAGVASFKTVADGVAGHGAQAGLRTGSMFPVTEGISYDASMWVKDGTTSHQFKMRLEWYDASNAYIATSSGDLITGSTTVWTQGTVTATAPGNATKGIAYLNVSGAAPTAGDVFFWDDAFITITGGPTVWDNAGHADESLSTGSGAITLATPTLDAAASAVSASAGSGALVLQVAVTSSAASASAGSGAFIIISSATSAATSTSVGSGAIVVKSSVTGSAASTSTGTGAAAIFSSVTSSASSLSDGSAAVSMTGSVTAYPITGSAASASAGSGAAAITYALTANAVSASDGSGAVVVRLAVSASATSTSDGSAAPALVTKITASSASVSGGSGAFTVSITAFIGWGFPI